MACSVYFSKCRWFGCTGPDMIYDMMPHCGGAGDAVGLEYTSYSLYVQIYNNLSVYVWMYIMLI